MMATSGATTDCDTTDLFPSETQDACDLQYSTLSGEKKNLTSEQDSVQEKNHPIMVGPHPRMEFALTSMSSDDEEKNALTKDLMLDSGNQEGPDNKDVKISVSEEENELYQEKFSAAEDVHLPLSEDLSCCDENNEADNQSTTADGVEHSTGCDEQGEDKYLKNENKNLKPVIFSSSLGSLLSPDINCGTAEQRIEDGPLSLESDGFISCENSPENSAMGSSVIKRPVDLNGSNESSRTGRSSAVSPLGSEYYFSCEDSSLILDTVTIEENIEPEDTESHTVDDQEISGSKLPLNHYASEEDEKLSADLNWTINKGLDLEKQQPCEDEENELHEASLNDKDIEIKRFDEDEVTPLESESYSLGEDLFLDHKITVISKETVNSENCNCTFEEREERLVYENKEKLNSFVTHEEKMSNADVSHTLPCSQERSSLILNTLIIDELLEVNVASEFNSDFNRTESVKNENNEQIEEEKPFSPDESINLNAENFAINADESMPLDMENNVAINVDKSMPLDMENNFAINADESMPLCMESDVAINADESMPLDMESNVAINVDEIMALDMENNVAINADESMPLCMGNNAAITVDKSIPLNMENNFAVSADKSMHLDMEYNFSINEDAQFVRTEENLHCCSSEEGISLRGEEVSKIGECQLSDAASSDMNSKLDSSELVGSQGATVESYGSNEEDDNLTLRNKLLSEQVEHKFTPASGPENISAVCETDVNDPELQKSADCVDFVRDPVSRYGHVVTADPSKGRMTDRSRVSDHGMLQTDKADRSFVGKLDYEQILDAEPFAEGRQKLRYFPELDASGCGEVMDFKKCDPFENSESYLEVPETVELKAESSAETVQDMGNKLTCNEISPQKWNYLQFVSSEYAILSETSSSVAVGIEGQKEKDLNRCKNFQSAELPCGKEKPIDWEVKTKVLEKCMNKLAEQNKELHSHLQSHLENESSMSLQLDVLSNKLTVTEGEMCLLQNENNSLISDLEKMKTDTEYLLLKHREELEVLRAKCLKEKQEEVALLEDQLKQTLQQHNSVLRVLEWKFKALEEEKNELAEQKKELHSQLQSHLENDLSVSLESLVLSNKLTVTEGEMCLLQNENNSLLSDLEKMKTDMVHVLQKHWEELEVLCAKCLKEKQEEVALLEDQLEQTLQQHNSVLRELEGRQREASTASEMRILLREENESVNRNLAISEEKIASLNSTLQEGAAVKCVSQMVFELQEEINIKETQYSELCSHLGRIETEISGNLGGDNSASVANRVERLTEQIQLRRTLNEQVSYMLSECEKNKASLQTLCDITVMLQEKLQFGVCESDLAETVRYLLDTKDQVEDEVTLAKSDFESCAEHVECLPNQIKHLEDTNSELKADFESCKRTLCDVRQQKNALKRSLGEKLTALSAEMSTVLTKTAEWKSKYQASEKLVANYEEQVASLRKVKSQLNGITEEGEEDLQKTYEESKELKIKISNMVGETEKVRKAMCVDYEDPDYSKDLMLQYRKVVNFFKTKNDNISEQVKVAEQKFLKVCREKETMAVIISDLGEEMKSLQVSLQEKDEEVKGLISELAATNHFLSGLESEFDCVETRVSGTVDETSEKLNKVCLEKEMLSGENKKLLSEIEMLKQVQLVKCKKEADDQEVLAAKVKTLNGELEALKQKLHEQSIQISELKFQREELLKDFDQLRRKNKVLESKDEEYSKMSENNKCLIDLVKELKKQVIEIEDENRSAFEKLDIIEKAKAEVEEEWISKCRTCHKIESLCKKVSQLNNVLLGSCTDKHHLCDDKQFGCSISEVEEKNGMHSTSDRDSDQMASWNSLCDHFELLNAKFAELSGNVEVVAQRKEAVEKNSAADCDLERCRRDIDDWRNAYKKVESFISDVMTEMNFPKSLLKPIRGDDRVLNPKGCEDSLMRDLHQIKEHLRHACKKNLHLESRMEIFKKRLLELKDERRKISEECLAEKMNSLDGTSQVYRLTVKIEKLTYNVKCLEKANCRLEEEACALRMKVCNLKRREVDFHQEDKEVSRKLEILSSEINNLLDNNKHLKKENQTLVKEVNAKKKCDRETVLLKSNITSLRRKVAEYESEIMQLKAEKQQSQALQCMDSSDMTVNLPSLRLFPNPAASSVGTTCDNFTEEIKNDIKSCRQALRDAYSSVQKLLIQFKTFEEKRLQKIWEDLRQELADKNAKENENPLRSFVQKTPHDKAIVLEKRPQCHQEAVGNFSSSIKKPPKHFDRQQQNWENVRIHQQEGNSKEVINKDLPTKVAERGSSISSGDLCFAEKSSPCSSDAKESRMSSKSLFCKDKELGCSQKSVQQESRQLREPKKDAQPQQKYRPP